MNKNIPKVFLGVVISSMVIIGVSTSINQPKFDIIDISGKQEDIGDVKIISQSSESLYTSHKNTLSKDGFEVKAYAKPIESKMEVEDIINQDKDFFKPYYNENTVFKTDYVLGFLNSETDYKENNTYIRYMLKIKNLENKQEQMYNFESLEKIEADTNIEFNNYVLTKGKDIYIFELVNKGIEYDREGIFNKVESSKINVYKFNLENGDIEEYNSIDTNGKEGIEFSNKVSFKYNNKVYFTINKKEETKQNSYIGCYDLNTNKFSYIKEQISLENEEINNYETQQLYTYTIEDDILEIVSNDNKNNNTMEIKRTSIDLKNNKILLKDNSYAVERLYKQTAINNARSIDGKLYVIISNIEPKRKERDTKNSIIVLDENTKKVLYIGQYKEDPICYSDYKILKNSEI